MWRSRRCWWCSWWSWGSRWPWWSRWSRRSWVRWSRRSWWSRWSWWSKWSWWSRRPWWFTTTKIGFCRCQKLPRYNMAPQALPFRKRNVNRDYILNIRGEQVFYTTSGADCSGPARPFKYTVGTGLLYYLRSRLLWPGHHIFKKRYRTIWYCLIVS